MYATEPMLHAAPAARLQRLLVSRREPAGLYMPIGFLEARTDDDGTIEYAFSYLRSVASSPDFRPLLGFREPRRYTSAGLFPLFSERLMDPRRPDHPQYLAALDLDAGASPLMILERSAGHRIGDTIELSPVPVADEQGASSCVFLVHGVRHIAGAEERISTLHDGDPLALRSDSANQVNPDAVHVALTGADGVPVGWVPNVLLDYVHHLAGVRAAAVRVNGPEAGPRLRLLVQVDGQTAPGWSPFNGPEWTTAG